MGIPKATTFLIALVLGSLFIGVFNFFILDYANNYGVEYDNATLAEYNKMIELSNQSKEIKEDSEALQEKTNPVDILGDYFSGAYQALKTTAKGINTFDDMVNQGLDDANLGPITDLLKATLITIMIILVFIGIIIAAAVKRDL